MWRQRLHPHCRSSFLNSCSYLIFLDGCSYLFLDAAQIWYQYELIEKTQKSNDKTCHLFLHLWPFPHIFFTVFVFELWLNWGWIPAKCFAFFLFLGLLSWCSQNDQLAQTVIVRGTNSDLSPHVQWACKSSAEMGQAAVSDDISSVGLLLQATSFTIWTILQCSKVQRQWQILLLRPDVLGVFETDNPNVDWQSKHSWAWHLTSSCSCGTVRCLVAADCIK